jgi:hypothetical protein
MNFLQVLKRNGANPEIRVGCQYCRQAHTGITETAEVVDMKQDSLGIPHVRFLYSVQRNGRIEQTDYRTLALEAFRGMFPAVGSA